MKKLVLKVNQISRKIWNTFVEDKRIFQVIIIQTKKIDNTKTKYNYDLKERNGLSAKEYFDNRIKYIEELTLERTGKSIRKDAVKLCSWILTVPKDLPKQKQADFFKYGYEFLYKRYHGNGENVITASVHLDETTPHMHFQFIPIVMDTKGGFEKLCAKNLETRTSLAKVHQEMKSYLEKKLQCEVNILNGATENGNKSILELKNESLKSKNEQLSKENAMMEHQLKELEEKKRN